MKFRMLIEYNQVLKNPLSKKEYVEWYRGNEIVEFWSSCDDI